MAEDLRLPAELLDDGFFHDFFVDGNDKVRDLLNEATRKGAAEAELRRWSQHQHRLSNQARNPSPLLANRQLQAARIRDLKQQQLLQQQFWLERQRDAKGLAGRCPSFSPSRRSTPFLVPHQPLPASGMTAIFLSSSGAKKEPTGTGVFLPRTSNSKPQPQKKSGNPHPQHQPTNSPPGVRPFLPMSYRLHICDSVLDRDVAACSTVLIPAKVVQALNLVNHHDSFMGRRTNPARTPQPAAAAIRTPMSCLPQEWTY